MKIIHINPNSLGERIGLKPGDRLLKINNKKVLDEIDYKFRIIEESLILDFEINGKFERVEIQKDYDIDLGVHFEELKIRACANDCVFCFVDQNPPGMRSGMYFRDGDYRMSYLYGHYVTMTNMGQEELDRIVKQRLSPLYISVHATDVELRKRLLRAFEDGVIARMTGKAILKEIQVNKLANEPLKILATFRRNISDRFLDETIREKVVFGGKREIILSEYLSGN